MKQKKRNKDYIAILDRPIEVLKKPMGKKVDFDAVMNDILHYNPKKNNLRSYKGK